MTIIKRTRIKFFTVMSSIVMTIVVVFCASVLISTHSQNQRDINMILQNMASNFDRPDKPSPDNNRFDNNRGFTVRLNDNFEIEKIDYNRTIFNESEIEQYVNQIHETGKTTGKIGNIQFLLKEVPHGKILACLDIDFENSMYSTLVKTVLLAGGGSVIVLFAMLWLISYWIIKPAEEAFKKQKRFISEAGHELKTPLTVISVGIELLQKDISDINARRHLNCIEEQTEKLKAMTYELLALSKIEELEGISIKSNFDLSQAILTEALAFESVAFENGKEFVCEIEENLQYKGDSQSIRQAIRILCDNAIIHSDANDTIKLQLKKQATKLVFSISNTSSALKKDEISFLFERFFRGSESRHKTSGTGLGLSILKTLADKNDWKISVDTLKNIITFSIIF